MPAPAQKRSSPRSPRLAQSRLAWVSCILLVGQCASLFEIVPSALTQSISNASEVSSLELSFHFTFAISKPTTVWVSLPQTFAIDPLKVFCDPPCALDVPNLKLSFPFSSGVEKLLTYSVSIFNVTNPALQGSTSPFAVVALALNTATGQQFIFAQNLNFGSLGISEPLARLLSVSFKMLDHHPPRFRNYLHSEIAQASEDLVFGLGFRVPVYTPKDISLRLVFPIGSFQPENLICLQQSINLRRNFSDIQCHFHSDARFMYIVIQGFREDILANEALLFLLTLRNPPRQANATTFDIYIFKNGTNTALAKALQVGLPEVLPNQLSKLSLQQVNPDVVLSGNKVVWTRLRLATLSTLPEHSEVSLVLPPHLDLHVRSSSLSDLQNSLLIFSGLEKSASGGEIALKKDSIGGRNRLTISNFQAHTFPRTVELKLLLSIGDISDYSDFFLVETGFRDQTSAYTLMERDQSSLRLRVVSVEVPSQHSLSLSNELADGVTVTDISFSFTAEVTVLAGDSLVLIVDDSVDLAVVESHKCLSRLTSTQSLADYSRSQQSQVGPHVHIKSPHCVGQNGKITMRLPFSYDIGQQIHILLQQVIVSPSLSAEYLFDFSLCRPQASATQSTESSSFRDFLLGNMLLRRTDLPDYFAGDSQNCEIYMSYTELAFFRPQNLTDLAVHFVPNVEDSPGLLTLDFLAPVDVISSLPHFVDSGNQDKR